MMTITQLTIRFLAQSRTPPLFASAKGGRGKRSETQGVHNVATLNLFQRQTLPELIRYLDVVRDAPTYRKVQVAVIPYFQEHER